MPGVGLHGYNVRASKQVHVSCFSASLIPRPTTFFGYTNFPLCNRKSHGPGNEATSVLYCLLPCRAERVGDLDESANAARQKTREPGKSRLAAKTPVQERLKLFVQFNLCSHVHSTCLLLQKPGGTPLYWWNVAYPIKTSLITQMVSWSAGTSLCASVCECARERRAYYKKGGNHTARKLQRQIRLNSVVGRTSQTVHTPIPIPNGISGSKQDHSQRENPHHRQDRSLCSSCQGNWQEERALQWPAVIFILHSYSLPFYCIMYM